MSIYDIPTLAQRLAGNRYPGRGIVIGLTPNGKQAVSAYFIMGRSANSRNRVFKEREGCVYTEPFDPSKVEDPSLIIYAAVRSCGNHLIVTNGDQTDTIYKGLAAGLDFEDTLEQRCFEPDGPNWTPRISGLLTFQGNGFRYRMSILKSGDEAGTVCNRYGFRYAPKAGLGHFIHTYQCDGNPIPTFQGEPERVVMYDDIDTLTQEIWNSLDEENKISLYVRYTDLASGAVESRMINKNH